MALAAGSRLGAYQILAPLGAGGMGEVYKARDTKLDREVAIKVLPQSLAADSVALARFEREAKAVAALSHPNILAIHDLAREGETTYAVMELLDGETLGERLSSGPLPTRKAIEIGREIAVGLAAAHEKGIVHRDLKPANLFLMKDGRVKILDFGLARQISLPKGEETQTPTVTRHTEPGTVLGTVGYMSPEQLRGEPADARCDVFSFGAVLYEMVSGRRAFRGDTAIETMNAILKEDPPELSTGGRAVPPALERIVAHCLEKRPEQRFQSAQDLAFDLELVSTVSGVRARPPQKPLASWASRRRSVVAALGLALGALALGALAGRLIWRPQQPSTSLVRVHRLTELTGLEEFPALSPDGRSVAFTADVDGRRQLWVRLIVGGPALQITRDPTDHLYPRWSRDSSSILYFSPPLEGEEAGSLWEVSALGGTPRRLANSLSGADASSADDHIAFFRLGTNKIELVVAKRDGSDRRVMVALEPGYDYATPRWSPDGRTLAYERRSHGRDQAIFSIRSTGTNPKQLTRGTGQLNGFAWLPDSSGIVFSSSRGSIMLYLETFQLSTLRLDDGRPRQLTFGEVSYVHPDLGHAGTLVASRMRMRSDLWRFPVEGNGAENVRGAMPVTRQTAEVRTPSVSPDGREVVYVSDIAGHSNLWVTRLDTGESRQLTFERDPNLMIGVPLWSPDGRQIAFYWSGESSYGYSSIQPDGSGLRQILSKGWWACWSPDGRWLYYQDREGIPVRPLKKLPIDGGSPVIVRTDSAFMPALSPDGKTLYFGIEVLRAAGAVDYEIRSASPEDGPSRLLARLPWHRMPDAGRFQPVISPDGRWLALPLTDGVTTNIWALSTTDGVIHRLTDFGHRPTFISRRVSWSPDGRSIYAAVSEGDSDIVLIDGLTW
ncbi:MAG TPA: protein kinase [Thermoanaerobaculia bacterium]